METERQLRFNTRCLRALGSAAHRCIYDESYIKKGVLFHEDWIRNPTDFVIYMANLPGAEFVEEYNLTIRRRNLKQGYFPGNVFWHHIDSGIIFGSEYAAKQFLEYQRGESS